MALAAVLASCVAGCGGDLTSSELDAAIDAPGASPLDGSAVIDSAVDAAPADASPAVPTLSIVEPADGARFVRDTVVADGWAADVVIRVAATGIDRVELVTDASTVIGTVRAPGWSLTHAFRGDGARTITAIGRSATGDELARAEIEITIAPPADASCHAMLDALGLDWEPLASLRGVADPVRVQPLIAGVRFRYAGSETPTAMAMDCELAPRLVRLAELVEPYGIDEVIHLGIYNYRCIGGGDPDSGTCEPSQHAYARAIDLHAFGLAESDATYSTEDDFVITMREDTCPMMSSSEPDRVLKDIACALYEDAIFQVVLTPNYNDAHRNHYHVDLTEGSMYLGLTASGVDPAVSGLGH
jgi:hypothetical protein